VDPEGEGVGHHAIDAAAQAVLDRFPDFHFAPSAPPTATGDLGRLAWEMRTPDDVVTVRGMDIALIADGRITRFWVFLEAPSPSTPMTAPKPPSSSAKRSPQPAATKLEPTRQRFAPRQSPLLSRRIYLDHPDDQQGNSRDACEVAGPSRRVEHVQRPGNQASEQEGFHLKPTQGTGQFLALRIHRVSRVRQRFLPFSGLT
jgi:hypothetical protein